MPLALSRGPIMQVNYVWSDALDESAPVQTRRRRPCPETAPRVLRTAEAARYLGVSPWTLRRLVADGQLSFLPGKFLRFDRQELDAYISREKIRL